jgi:ankyrin repeat protein
MEGIILKLILAQYEERDRYNRSCLRSLAFLHHRKRQNLGTKTEGTCDWIRTHKMFLKWTESGGSLLVSGRAGTGKSTLIDSMIDDSTKNLHHARPTAIASFFFHRQGETLQHSLLGIFRSLLHQLLTQDSTLLAKFVADTKFEERCKNEGEPGPGQKWDWTESEIRDCLTGCLQTFLQDHKLWLYVDGLDESGESHARDVWNYLKEQLEQSRGRLNVCISCRPYPDVVFNPDYSINVDDENQEDISTYLQAAFKAEQRWQSRSDLKEIQNTLKARACGVFQWVVIVTADMLGRHWENKDVIITKIQKAPKALSDLYQDMLQSLVQKSRVDGLQALRILRWITFAARPLSLTELRYAVATDSDKPLLTVEDCKQSEHWCDDEDTMAARVRTLSQGLAKVVDRGPNIKTVEFDHESVKEYMSERGIEFLEDKTDLAKDGEDQEGRAHHILYNILIRHLMTEEASSIVGWKAHYAVPLLDYAVAHWVTHAKIADNHGMSLKDLVDLTEWPSNRICAQWQWMHERFRQSSHTTLQHVAARYGLCGLVAVLVAKCRMIKARRWRKMLKLLRRHGDDIDVEDSYGLTPLWWAADGRHEDIVKMLLATGKVDVDCKNISGQTPLSRAADGGHEGIVKMLLATGKVDADCRDFCGRTPLSRAADGGHEGIVKMLLGTGKVDADCKEEDGQTPLWRAANGGHEGIVKMLLAIDKVDADCKDKYGWTPLWRAANGGHEGIVKMLLAIDKVDPDCKDKYGGTPLWRAAKNGHEGTVKILLATGKVDPDYKDENGHTPLWVAAHVGHEGIVKMLRSFSE